MRISLLSAKAVNSDTTTALLESLRALDGGNTKQLYEESFIKLFTPSSNVITKSRHALVKLLPSLLTSPSLVHIALRIVKIEAAAKIRKEIAKSALLFITFTNGLLAKVLVSALNRSIIESNFSGKIATALLFLATYE